MALHKFQIAFWIVSVCFALFGLGITIFGWKVNARNARDLAKTKDIHDAVDTCIETLIELEDLAYAFWLNADSPTKPYQLVVCHTRLLVRLKQLQALRTYALPSNELRTLRRYCTLDAETKSAPINSEDERIKRISKAATDILQSAILQKTWEGAPQSIH
jgi:hypothetical protein